MNDQVENYDGDAWPLPQDAFSHPRSNGTFAKILRSYVRERGLMTLQEALRKMTLMPAQTLEGFVPQMKTKGRMQVGMDADIVVFDPETISDVGTYQDPNHPAVDLEWLLVHGEMVVARGELIVDVFAGGRYFNTEPSIEITPIIGNPRSVSSSESRIDPFLGARVVWDLSYRWLLGFRGDVGGFGIGDAADFTWQATAEVSFRISRRVAVGAGYRVLEYDTIEGEGDSRSGYDLRMSGAIVGLGISF
jgi:hypothetical protein